MNISRSFLLIGSLYLLVGIGLGSHMGASGDHTLAPVHAHINLLGFVLMTLFGLAYRVMPAMGGGMLPKAHFWLHQAGSLVLLIGLFLMMGGMVAAESIGPVFPLAELSILAGVVCFLVNLWRHA
ncbi:hypothetical protein GCM10011452_15780 [Gemmobacter lanyuensis]|uniref:Cytochrome-c oxidase n=1 Tax=Gemmobacter lanyuensis TaxID=1054497 RepID=A0A918MJH7_9RHOB|nr:TonB-dependent receptor [Gemmobacter lanyuensis]GGW27998.1 hypothetical protein GCM10011452_15780 [Gemmobacter lanyuensis]